MNHWHTRSMRGAMVFASLAVALSTPGCGKKGSSTEASAPPVREYNVHLAKTQAMVAVELTVANIDSLVNGSGYSSYTAEDVVKKIVPMMNSAEASGPGEKSKAVPHFTYVAGAATAPWQVAVRAEGSTVHVEAFGSNTTTPIEQRSITVR